MDNAVHARKGYAANSIKKVIKITGAVAKWKRKYLFWHLHFAVDVFLIEKLFFEIVLTYLVYLFNMFFFLIT